MAKLLLIDGSNMMFKAYFGTAYSGQLMQRSDGFYTNALYGLVNILNKVLKDDFTHVLVAFDDGKETHRHLAYPEYKAGRKKMPEEFRMQLPYINELIGHMGLFQSQHKDLEADDIIASVASQYQNQFESIEILSSDKDLYQIITDKIKIRATNVKSGSPFFDINDLKSKWGITPNLVADLKGLMGDPSDNLPGVPGVGEKTAMKLIQEYGSLEGLYENINEIKGKLKEKLITYQKDAFKWREMARLLFDAKLPFDLDDLAYQGPKDSLGSFYQTMEFHSLLRKLNQSETHVALNVAKASDESFYDEKTAIHLESFGDNYHLNTPLGFGLYNQKGGKFIAFDDALNDQAFVAFLSSHQEKLTFDLKALLVTLNRFSKTIQGVNYDLLLAAYILDPNSTQKNMKELCAFFDLDVSLEFEETIYGKGAQFKIPEKALYERHAMEKAKIIYETETYFLQRLQESGQKALLETIEMPLSFVLADMEIRGIKIDLDALKIFGDELDVEMNALEEQIYFSAGEPFNIGSPKQLGEILFEKMKLPVIKKTKTGYSTNIDVLKKLEDKHPIITSIMRYRTLSKLKSTYVNGLIEAARNGRIHTIYKQALTQTGRLSSIEPNLQNLPIRTKIGQALRKVFVADQDSVLLASDYSQIELRLLAHFSNDQTMVEAFNQNEDIHAITASKVFSKKKISSSERRMAKAVNFGIIYGQSSYGLSEELGISVSEADGFIKRYYEDFSSIKGYLDDQVKYAYDHGYVKTLLNRRRYIKELSQNNYMIRNFGERTAMNAPLQGSAADIIKKAMIDLDIAFKKEGLNSHILLQIHDELVINVFKDELEKVKALTQKTMEQCVKLSIPLSVNIASGDNLYEAK